MPMVMKTLLRFRHLLYFNLSLDLAIRPHYILSQLLNRTVAFPEAIFSTYFRFCNLHPMSVDLDHQTTMHFWVPNHIRFHKPNLVMIHGYGGNSRWHFFLQVAGLSEKFNLYVPDLLFFGDSHTKRAERTAAFQAECVCQGLKRLGVERFSIYAISYGGYVGYQMAEMYGEMVDKVVIVSAGIGCTEEQKEALLKKIGRNIVDLLVPSEPEGYRTLLKLSMYKYDIGKWIPDFYIRQYIRAENDYKKEKQELIEYLLAEKGDSSLPVITQETLLIWGDKDIVFPPYIGQQLHRHLGQRSKFELIKNTGHASHIESPHVLNQRIISFVLGGSNSLVPNS